MRREGVAQQVGVDAGKPRRAGVALDDLPDGHPFEGAAGAAQEDAPPVPSVRLRQPAAAVVQIGFQRGLGGFAKGNEALLGALAGDCEEAECPVDAFEPEVRGLGGAESRAVEKLEQCPVAQPDGERAWVFGRLGGLDERADLGFGEDFGDFLPLGGALDEFGERILGVALGGEPPAEDAHGGDMARDGGCLEGAFAPEVGEVLDEEARGEGVGGGDGLVGEVVEEVVEIAAVGGKGVGGEAALDAQVVHEPVAGIGEWEWGAHVRTEHRSVRGR